MSSIRRVLMAWVLDSVFSVSRRLFDLPLQEKQLIDKRNSRHFRGREEVGRKTQQLAGYLYTWSSSG